MQNFMKTVINAVKSWTKDWTTKKIDEVSAELNTRIDNSQADWNESDESKDSYIKNKPDVILANDFENFANEVDVAFDNKMDATNPVGTGSFSFGKDTSSSAASSIAIGSGLIANRKEVTVLGSLNIEDEDLYGTGEGVVDVDYKIISISKGAEYYVGTGYTFDTQTGLFTLINPTLTVVNDKTVPNGSSFYGCRKNEDPTALSAILLSSSVRWYVGSSVYVNVAKKTSVVSQKSKGKYVLVVGNGMRWLDSSIIRDYRSNAHTLDWNGVGWFQGGLQVGGNAQDDGAKNVMLEGDAQPFFILVDDTTSYEYIIRMHNGNLTSVCKASSIAVTTPPTKTTYTVGEALDLTGMVVTLTRQDGATEEVNNYTYTEPDMSVAGSVDVSVSYVEANEIYSAVFGLTIVGAETASEETVEEGV